MGDIVGIGSTYYLFLVIRNRNDKNWFSKVLESKKHKINELCSAISYAAIYGGIHFAIVTKKLIAKASCVVESQSAVL